jgi:hypothetical protein
VRSIKMLGLAMTAAIAAMAFVGAGSASADALCKTNPGHTKECPAPLATGTLIKGLTLANAPATLLDEEKEAIMTCHSTALGTLGASLGSHKGRAGLLTSLSFSNCTGICASAEGINEPYALTLDALALTAHVTEHAQGGTPGAFLNNCFFFFDCEYELVEGLALLTLSGDTLIASNEELFKSGGSGACPEVGYWDASYLVTTDNAAAEPLFATSLP